MNDKVVNYLFGWKKPDVGLCGCGCGKATSPSAKFVPGHHARKTAPGPRAAVRDDSGCWEWQGYTTQAGYGQIHDKTKGAIYAHRFVWEMVHGALPKATHLLHSCDNPKCVNPAHLSIGDQASNIADMVSKKRHTFGARNGQAKLTEEAAQAILDAKGTDPRSLAERYEVSVPAVYDIWAGRRWKHLSPTHSLKEAA